MKVEQKGAPYDGKHPNESTGGRPAAAAGPSAFGGEGVQLGETKTATLDKDAAKSTVDASKAVTKLQALPRSARCCSSFLFAATL